MSDSVRNIRAKVYINNKQAGKSLRDLEGEARKLRNQLKRLPRDSEEFGRKKGEFKKIQQELRKTKQEMYGVNKGWSGMANSFNKYFTLVTAGIAAITGIILTLKETITRAAELSDLRADVQKTTNLTNAELDRLQKKFDEMNTRTPRAELLKIAAEAGKMGERGVENIADFVEQSNKILVALGEDLGDDAILKIGKMSDIFNVEMENIGSGINAVSDATKANAGFLTEWLSRLAGISKELKIKAGDVLGYGATLDELGLKVEMSSTALNGFLADFTKNTDEFGQVAGFAEGELRKLIGEEGVNAGFIAFLEKMRESTDSSEDFLQKLEAVGVTGDRGSQVFLALSQNLDQVRERQALANAEIASGTSLQNEYNRKNENFAANLAKIRRALMAKFMSSDLLKALERFAAWGAEIVRTPVSEKLEEERIKLRSLEFQIYETNLKQGDRIKLINELKNISPTQLAQIEAEKVSNEELSVAVEKLNKQYLDRIIIKKNAEALEANEEDIQARTNAMARTELEIANKLAKVQHEHNFEFNKSLSIVENARIAFQKYGMGITNLFTDAHDLGQLVAEYEGHEKVIGAMENIGNSIKDQRQALVEMLGLTDSLVTNLEDQIFELAATLNTEGVALLREFYKNDYKSFKEFERKKLNDAGLTKAGDKNEDNSKDSRSLLGTGTNDEEGTGNSYLDKLKATGNALEAEAESQRRLMENSLKQLYEYEKLQILESDAFKLATKEEQQATLEALELEHLERLRAGREQLGMDTIDLDNRIAEIAVDNANKVNEAKQKEIEALEAEAESQRRLMENSLKQLWDYERAALLEQEEFKKLSKEEQQQALWELELEHLKRVLDGRKQLGMDTMAIEDQIRAHKEEQTEAMRKAEKKHQESMAESMAMSAFNAASQARDAQAAKNAVLNSIRSEIQAYLAKAIAGAIAKEFATKGLLGAVTGGLAAGAAGVLFNSLVPRFNTGGFTGSGFLNDPQVPGRKMAGITHEDEYVVASEELARPDVQQMVGQIESLRQSRFGGGGAASAGSAGTHKVINNTTTQKIEVEGLSQVVLQLTSVLKDLQDKGIPAIADDRFRRDLEIMQAKEDFINRKSAIRK
jgi:TP901 family phage tail tape measure protein